LWAEKLRGSKDRDEQGGRDVTRGVRRPIRKRRDGKDLATVLVLRARLILGTRGRSVRDLEGATRVMPQESERLTIEVAGADLSHVRNDGERHYDTDERRQTLRDEPSDLRLGFHPSVPGNGAHLDWP
jgi:hypothetical protein